MQINLPNFFRVCLLFLPTFFKPSGFSGLFLYAFALGTIFPRLGDLQLEMGLSETQLGLSLMGLPIGVQLSLLVANRIVNYFTLAQVMIFGLIMIKPATQRLLVGTPIWFFFALLFAGLSVGALEVAVNLEADRVEFGLKQRIMSRSHAFWSLGFFVTGLFGAVMAQLGVSVVFHFASFGVLVVALTVFIFSGFISGPAAPIC